MTKREKIAGTVHRIAEAHERSAMVGLGRAEEARREAAAQVAELEAENVRAEAELAGTDALGGVERELLWTHRAWVRRERESTEERLAITEAEVEAAKARLLDRKRDTRVREHLKDHVRGEARAGREAKAQRELDEFGHRGPRK